MKKIFTFIFVLGAFFILSSCGEAAPVKEIEDAKSAIERAKSVEAPSYAKDPYNEAESSLKEANDFIGKKKNKEAKEKAVTSKNKAELAYNMAITNRANVFYNDCANLLAEIEKYFGQKVEPENYEAYKNDFQTMTTELEAKNYDSVYTKGKELKPKLESFLARLKELYNDVSLKISMVEGRLEDLKAEDNAEANKFLLEAEGKISEAKEALGNGEYELAMKKVKEAEELCDKADEIINPKAKVEKGVKPVREREVTPGKEVSGDEALEAIKRAKEKQEELKKRKKIIYYKYERKSFVNIPKAIMVAEEVNISDESVTENEKVEVETETAKGEEQVDANVSSVEEESIGDEEVTSSEEVNEEEIATEDNLEEEKVAIGDEEVEEIKVKDEDITEEMVNKYISIAEELYEKGEYSKSLLYANEAVRMADYLLEKDYSKFYKVRRGDCLWNIAKFFYKRPMLWPIIYKANKNKIKHPDLIYPNQVFEIPPQPKNVDVNKLYKEINYKPLFR